VQEIAGELFDLVSNKVVRPEIVRSVEGEELDIDAYNEGKPECFLVYQDGEEESDGSGVVRILANLTASWNVSAEVLEVRGAALCALVQALEFAGRRCEVVTGTNQGTMQVTVTLKRATEPVQMDTLAFALAHAGFYRRLMFSAWETLPKQLLKAAGIYPNRGYGHVEALEDVQADITLPGASGNDPAWQSVESARAWVLKQLREQGVQLVE
jgi:hypothetical protein